MKTPLLASLSVALLALASLVAGCATTPRSGAPAPAPASPANPATAEALLAAIRARDAEKVESELARHPELAAVHDAKGRSAVLVALFTMKSKDKGEGEGFLRPQENRALRSLLARRPPLDRFETAAVGDADRVANEAARDGAYVREVSPLGWTALHYAAFGGNARAAAVLLDRGAAIDAVAANEFANTPLQVSLLTQQEELARLLVARGANVRFRQHEGYTALHEAVFGGKEPIVRLLLDAGADPSARAEDGTSPLGIARKKHHPDLEALLLARGAKE